GEKGRDHARHDRAQPAAPGAEGCRHGFEQGRRDRQPAHVRGSHFVHRGRGAGGGALGALQRRGQVEGGAARNDFYEKNQDVLKRIIRAWIPANDYLLAKPEEALKVLHQKQYPNLTWEDIQEMNNATRWYTSADWVKHYRDGSVAKWLNQVTNF